MIFREYVEKQQSEKPVKWSPDEQEVLRSIRTAANYAVDHSPRSEQKGIDELNFEIVDAREAATGTRLKLEVKGLASARSEANVKALLKRLVEDISHTLAQKRIHIVLYHHQTHILPAEGGRHQFTTIMDVLAMHQARA